MFPFFQDPTIIIFMNFQTPDENFLYIVNIEGITLKDDRILMITRSEQELHAPGVVAFPGGKVENVHLENDVLENTIRREILEETGITVKAEMHYLSSRVFESDDGYPVVDILFVCQYESGEPHVTDPDEVQAVHWMTFEEAVNHPKLPPWTQNDLIQLQQAGYLQ